MIDFAKQIQLDEISPEGEPTVQIIRPYEKLHHVKVASDALDYVKTVKPQPGKTIILVLAMTAGEYYGCNRNGDAWSEGPITAGPTIITPDQVLPKHHKTFEDAHVFRHHINKDPRKALGEILRAFYNWPMHRVELLLSLDNRKAEDIVERIERDEFPAVSMGCKVKYDVCNICGNMAPNRRHYCKHARNFLGIYLPDGRRVWVWNPNPRFFDLSMVRRPADELGFMMKKVADDIPNISSAELGEYIANAEQKIANLKKLSIIHKILRGETIATNDGKTVKVLKKFSDDIARPAAENAPDIDESALKEMSGFRPAELLSSLASKNTLLSLPEFSRLVIWKFQPETDVPDDVLKRAVAILPGIFQILISNPELLTEIEDTGFTEVCSDNVREHITKKFSAALEKRALDDNALYRRLAPDVFNCGPPLRTTKVATIDLTDKTRLQQLLGAGGLLYGSMLLSAIPGLRWVALAPGVAGGLLGYEALKPEPSPEVPDREALLGLAQNQPWAPISPQWAKFSSDLGQAMVSGGETSLEEQHLEKLSMQPFEIVAQKIGEVICP